MKKIYNISIIALLFFITSCDKSVENVNISPKAATEVPSDLLLNGAQVSSIVLYEGDWARLTGMWNQSFTGVDRQYVSLNNYVTTSGDYDASWSTAYRGVIGQCKLIIAKQQASNNRLMIGIAQVMEAQAFGTMADLFGDVPFSQACDPENYPTPKFDNQLDVYAGVQTMLDQAIDNLNSTVGVSPGLKDIFYAGDATSWAQAAHTLKARFYLHTKDYTSAATEAALGISAASSNMMAPHGSAYNSDFNLYYSFCVYDRDTYMTADDAVAPRLLDENLPLNYRGNANTNEAARLNYLYYPGGLLYASNYDLNLLADFDWGNSPADNGFFGASTPFPLVTYQENQLILAEAKMRGGDFSAALVALNEYRAYLASPNTYIGSGYAANFLLQYDPYASVDFETGGMDNHGLTRNEALLQEIIEERYVTFIGQLEQFNDVRRTQNAIGLTPVTGSLLPQRFYYPQSEINTNPNTPHQSAGDLFVPTRVN